ncbi:translation initiation factor IF-2-like [Trichosurus vulpecula]|uniref:translation initiation factor IF-2-like n=1 Tax=Trichosurus vulpecula TaxID=9337 RepID=UPI00186ACCAC|nr:translation initiation factor IF-2-like [Trichosurus vulpecula]
MAELFPGQAFPKPRPNPLRPPLPSSPGPLGDTIAKGFPRLTPKGLDSPGHYPKDQWDTKSHQLPHSSEFTKGPVVNRSGEEEALTTRAHIRVNDPEPGSVQHFSFPYFYEPQLGGPRVRRRTGKVGGSHLSPLAPLPPRSFLRRKWEPGPAKLREQGRPRPPDRQSLTARGSGPERAPGGSRPARAGERPLPTSLPQPGPAPGQEEPPPRGEHPLPPPAAPRLPASGAGPRRKLPGKTTLKLARGTAPAAAAAAAGTASPPPALASRPRATQWRRWGPGRGAAPGGRTDPEGHPED